MKASITGNGSTTAGQKRNRRMPKSPARDQDAYIHIAPPEMVVHEAGKLPVGSSSTGRAASDVEIWDDVPADADTMTALAWLRGFEAERGELCGRPDNSGWWVILQAARIPGLLAHWKERSADWQYFANKRFQHLISGKRRRFPKLKIQSTGIDWFSVQAAWEDETLAMTEADWARLHQSDDPYVKLSNGVWMEREEVAAMAEAVTALAEIGVQVGAGEQQVGAWQMSGAQQTAWKKLETLVDGDADSVIKQLRQAVTDFKGLPEIPEPKGLHAELRPYQKTGLHFLAYASRFKLGALLADDMGLGKTVQALAWLQHLREEHGRSPSLVICPASVVFNWNTRSGAIHAGPESASAHRGRTSPHAARGNSAARSRRHQLRAAAARSRRAAKVLFPRHHFGRGAEHQESRVDGRARGQGAEGRAQAGADRHAAGKSAARFVEHHGIRPSRLPAGSLEISRAIRSRRLAARARAAFQPHAARHAAPAEETGRAGSAGPDRGAHRLRTHRGPAQILPRGTCSAAARRFPRSTCRPANRACTCSPRSRACARSAVIPRSPAARRGSAPARRPRYSSCSSRSTPAGHKVLVFSQFVEMLKILKTELEEKGRPYFMLTGPDDAIAARSCRPSTIARSRRCFCSRSRRRARG